VWGKNKNRKRKGTKKPPPPPPPTQEKNVRPLTTKKQYCRKLVLQIELKMIGTRVIAHGPLLKKIKHQQVFLPGN